MVLFFLTPAILIGHAALNAAFSIDLEQMFLRDHSDWPDPNIGEKLRNVLLATYLILTSFSEHADGERQGPAPIWIPKDTAETFPTLHSGCRASPWRSPSACSQKVVKIGSLSHSKLECATPPSPCPRRAPAPCT